MPKPETFLEVLEAKTCKFIEGDVKQGTEKFCGNEKLRGKPYCSKHNKKCNINTPRFNDKIY